MILLYLRDDDLEMIEKEIDDLELFYGLNRNLVEDIWEIIKLGELAEELSARMSNPNRSFKARGRGSEESEFYSKKM